MKMSKRRDLSAGLFPSPSRCVELRAHRVFYEHGGLTNSCFMTLVSKKELGVFGSAALHNCDNVDPKVSRLSRSGCNFRVQQNVCDSTGCGPIVQWTRKSPY